jgi:hypothetical protein
MIASEDKAPVRRPWRFRPRSLLVFGTLVALIIGLAAHRIERNRRQREAVHELWQMGALTTESIDAPFLAPATGIDWIWHHREGWSDNLWSAHRPIAVLFTEEHPYMNYHKDYPSLPTEPDGVANAISSVPSIKDVFVEGAAMSPAEAERLRQLLPGIEIHQEPRTRHTR